MVVLADPEMVRLLMLRLVDGVSASMVTVLVPELAIVVVPDVELGARPVDQFAPSFQKPLLKLVHVAAPWQFEAKNKTRHATGAEIT